MASNMKYIKKIMMGVNEAAKTEGFQIAFVEPNNYTRFYVKMKVNGGYYEGITIVFELAMKEYPIGPPHFKVLTPKMWHPNISTAGSVCVSFLYDPSQWSPDYTIVTIFEAFKLLLVDANADGGHMNSQASASWREAQAANDFKKYMRVVKENTGVYDNQYDKYFEHSSPHCIIPLAEVQKVDTEKKETNKTLAAGFARLAKPKPIAEKPKSVVQHDKPKAKAESNDSDTDSDVAEKPKSKSKSKSKPKPKPKKSNKKKVQDSSDSDSDVEIEEKPKSKPKKSSKKKVQVSSDSDSDSNTPKAKKKSTSKKDKRKEHQSESDSDESD